MIDGHQGPYPDEPFVIVRPPGIDRPVPRQEEEDDPLPDWGSWLTNNNIRLNDYGVHDLVLDAYPPTSPRLYGSTLNPGERLLLMLPSPFTETAVPPPANSPTLYARVMDAFLRTGFFPVGYIDEAAANARLTALELGTTADQLTRVRIRDTMWVHGGAMPPPREVGRLARPTGTDALGGLPNGLAPLTEVRLDAGFDPVYWTESLASVHVRHLIMGSEPLARYFERHREVDTATVAMTPAFNGLLELSLASDCDRHAERGARLVIHAVGANLTMLTLDDDIIDDDALIDWIRDHDHLTLFDVCNFRDDSSGIPTLRAAPPSLTELYGLRLFANDLVDAFYQLHQFDHMVELEVSLWMARSRDVRPLRNFLARLRDCIPRIAAAGGHRGLTLSVWSGASVFEGDREVIVDVVYGVFPCGEYPNITIEL